MNHDTVQSHPETLRLAEENARLREELARLLSELEDLLHTVKPNLLALYQAKLGVWELRVLEGQVAVARLRRQIELAQASLNRGERPDPAAIGAALELAFRAWQTQVQEAAERIRMAETRLSHLLSPVDNRELKALYRGLVKGLHPDLNPSLTDDQRRLWLRVQTAYQAGDLTELRALRLLAEGAAAIPPPAKSLDQLEHERGVLATQVAALLQRMEAIESQPPFTLRHQLEDEAWVTARRQELEHQAEALGEQAAVLTQRWQECLRQSSDGPVFGQN